MVETADVVVVGGGVNGVSIAYALAKLVTLFTSVPTSLPFFAVTAALLVSGSVGLASGVYPAWRAARLPPSSILRAKPRPSAGKAPQ